MDKYYGIGLYDCLEVFEGLFFEMRDVFDLKQKIIF